MYTCSTKTIGPRGFIFGMEVGLDGGPLIFYISRSKAKGQSQIGMKICLFGANFGHRGYVCVRSGPVTGEVGTFGSVPTIFGILPNAVKRQGASSRKVSHYWQCAIEAGKVPN